MKSLYERKEQFVCNICNKTFLENDHLNQHVCDANFEHENYLNQHISYDHEVIKHLKSPEADKNFFEKKS